MKTNPDWQYESIAFHIEIPDGTGRCPATTQPIYRSFWPGQSVRASNHRFVPDLTVHAKMAPASLLEGVVMCAPLSGVDQDADAVRLLEQSTFGPTDALIAEVQANGAAAFVDAQLALSSSRYSVLPPVAANSERQPASTTAHRRCGRTVIAPATTIRYSCRSGSSSATRSPHPTSCGSGSRSRSRNSW